MRAQQIIDGRAEAGVRVSPLAVLMTERILAEREIARDAVMFPEERVELCRIVQSTLNEQRHLLSLATGQKNEEMTLWWLRMALFWGSAISLGLIVGLIWTLANRG